MTLSLLDTPGMKLRDWYVVYGDRPARERWFFRPLKPGFRHVELMRPVYYGPGVSDVAWLLLMPTYEMLEVEMCTDPRPPWVRCPQATVQRVTVARTVMSVRSWFDVGPPSCVEVAKMALGIRDFWLRTPWQLHQHIRKREGVLIDDR